MKQEELKKLSQEELLKKEKSTKTLIGIFIPIIILLLFFIFRDYFNGKELDMANITIVICSIGGMASLFPNLKKIQNELKERK